MISYIGKKIITMACKHQGMLYLCDLCKEYHCSDCDWNNCKTCELWVCNKRYNKEKKLCKRCEMRGNGMSIFREPYYINPFKIYKPSLSSLFGD